MNVCVCVSFAAVTLHRAMTHRPLLPALLLLLTTITIVTTQQQQTTIEQISPVGPNQRHLSCRVRGPDGIQRNFAGAIFFLNGTDVRLNLTASQFTEDRDRGEIMFTIRQEIEGLYSCGNGSAEFLSHNSIEVYGE